MRTIATFGRTRTLRNNSIRCDPRAGLGHYTLIRAAYGCVATSLSTSVSFPTRGLKAAAIPQLHTPGLAHTRTHSSNIYSYAHCNMAKFILALVALCALTAAGSGEFDSHCFARALPCWPWIVCWGH